MLTFFYTGGNRGGSAGFPTNFDTLSNQLVHLDISRCRLVELPSYLSAFANLLYLDARNNRIKHVDDELRNMLAEKNMYNNRCFRRPRVLQWNEGCSVGHQPTKCVFYCNYKDWEEDELYLTPSSILRDQDGTPRSATMMEEIVCTV